MTRVFTLTLLSLACMAAHAEWAISIHDAWIRHIPGDRPMAGYFVLENKGNSDRSLVGASSPAFGVIGLHKTVEQGATSSMRHVQSITVPAGGRIEFTPRGYHLMLMQRQQDLKVDDLVPVTLEFEDGGSQSAVFTIKPAWQE